MLRNCACVVIAHMLDATQLCLSCHCTHGGCYATVLVLSLHTWWMLRNCACVVIAHMVDATQLCLSCNCTHAGCYATVLVLSLHQQIVREGDPGCTVHGDGARAWKSESKRLRLRFKNVVHCKNALLQASACPPSSKADRYAVPRSDMETIEKIHTERASQPRPNHQT